MHYAPFQPNHVWTPEQDVFILQCRLDGLSALQTAQAMNETYGTALKRNAIIGKWKRLNAPPVAKPAKPLPIRNE